MKTLVIEGVDLLKPQSDSVLINLSKKIVNSHNNMEKLVGDTMNIPIENDNFFNNIDKMSVCNVDFKEKYNYAIMRFSPIEDGIDYYDFDEDTW